jgi:hypothetical protein
LEAGPLEMKRSLERINRHEDTTEKFPPPN